MAGHTISVSILADTKKFSSAMRNLSKETGLDRLGNAFKSAGTRVVNFFKNGIKLAGAFGLAVAGLAIKGGFERALKIEDAQAKLTGLGHSAKSIDTIMDSALASVKGTAAGLDEAATMAANAVAAGIEPGEDLTAALSLVNDAATIAGTSMGEMGSIFSKVWTSGRAQTQELNQIADRGIPIWTALAEHYGISADELRKMVSAGEVDAATFEQVMNEQLGGAALKAGDTTRGAFANMRAALSRVGESFLKEIFPMFRESFLGITGGLDDLAPHAEKAGAAIAAWIQDTAVPAVQSLWSWVQDTLVPALQEFGDYVQNTVVPALREFGDYIEDTIVPALQDMAAWVEENKDMLIGVVVAATTFVSTLMALNQSIAIINAVKGAFVALNAVMLANPIGIIVAAVAALVAGLAYFFTQTETGQAIWESAWSAIQSAAQVVADWFMNTALPALQAAWDGITAAADAAAAWFMDHVAPVFQAAGELILELWDLLWAGIQATWDTVGGPVMAIIETAVNTLQAVWEVAWDVMSTVLVAAWDIIKGTVETALAAIEGVIRTITAIIRGDWDGAWEQIKSTASTVWDGINAIVQTATDAILDVIVTVLSAIWDAWLQAWNDLKRYVSESWDVMKATASRKGEELLDWFRDLPGKILGAIGDLSSLLSNVARDVIDGFVGGLKAGFGRVKDELGRLTSLIPSWKGPPSRDKTLLKGAGQLVIQGFIDGLESQYGAVRSSLTDLTRDVAHTPFEAPDVALAGAGVPGQGRGHVGAGGGEQGADEAILRAAAMIVEAVTGMPSRFETVVRIDDREVAKATVRGAAAYGDRLNWGGTPFGPARQPGRR